MLVPDVNVLLHAHFEESKENNKARGWIDSKMLGDELVGTPDVVLSGFIRISTNRSLFATGPSMQEAFDAAERFHVPPNGLRLRPGPRHWDVFRELVLTSGIGAKDVSYAYLAAFAIENDATFVTFDRGFGRFPGLKLLDLSA